MPNKAPKATDDIVTTNENEAVTFNVLANDRDLNGDMFTVTAINNIPIGVGTPVTVTGGTVALNSDGTLTFTPTANYVGTPSFTYTISDPSVSRQSSATVSIAVNQVNDAPVVSGAVTGTATEDGTTSTLSALANVSDADTGATLSVNAPASLPAGVTYDAGAQTFSLDPTNAAYQSLAAGQTTTVTVSYTVSDGIAAPVAHSMTWTLTGTNDAPTSISVAGGMVKENSAVGTVVATLSATDPDNGDSLTFSILDSSGMFELVENEIRVKSGAQINYETAISHGLTVKVVDAAGDTYEEALQVAVLNEFGTFTGTSAANALVGTNEEDVIRGLGGNDSLRGLAGRDELRGGGGNDVLFGGGGRDALKGGKGSDSLLGRGGADLMHGGAGADRMTGGMGNDEFQFGYAHQGRDVITDFSNVVGNNDLFRISAAGFRGGLEAGGTLAATQFRTRADNIAQDADDRFIFRTTDKSLWFDVDGKGGAAAVMLADLQADAIVTSADILLM